MSNLFRTLEINGEKALKIIKEQAFNPEKAKTLKTSIFEKSVIKCTNQRFTKKLSGFFFC